MKRATMVLVGLFTAVSAMGQGPYALPVAETAAPAKARTAGITAGLNTGRHSILLGGRGSYAPLDGLRLFADAGWVEVSGWEGGPSFQGGAIYSLPTPLPFDVAARGTVYVPFVDSDASIVGATLGGVASRDLETLVPGLTVYGSAWLDVISTSADVHRQSRVEHVSEDHVYLALALGAMFRFSDRLSLFGELSYVDDPFIGGGVRVDL